MPEEWRQNSKIYFQRHHSQRRPLHATSTMTTGQLPIDLGKYDAFPIQFEQRVNPDPSIRDNS
jgi:hypothetical protein